MKYISNLDIATRDAFLHGYRVNDKGEVVSSGILKKSRVDNSGYLVFSYRYKKKAGKIPVHKLCAYQKYGDIAFAADCVRHLDGNRTNNAPGNIEIGTLSDNMMDIPKEVRKRLAKNATRHRSSYISIEKTIDIRNFFKETKSYRETMEKFNISSKGTLWYVLNKKEF